MSDNNIFFTIFERTITTTMQGDREECAGWDAGDELAGEYTTLGDAMEKAREWALQDTIETHETRYGIGSMTRPVYEVSAWTEDEDGNFFTCNSHGEPSDHPAYVLDVLNLHPEYIEAWNKAKADYWKFLDYEADGYGCFTHYLEEE